MHYRPGMMQRLPLVLFGLLLPLGCAGSAAAPNATVAQCPEPAAPTVAAIPAPGPRPFVASLVGDPVRVNYWVVVSNAKGIDGFPVPADVAAVVAAAGGAGKELKLLSSTAIESMPEMHAKASGARTRFEQTVFSPGEQLVVDIEINTSLHTDIESRVSLVPGELTLVGSGAYKDRSQGDAATVGQVFYVVMAGRARPAVRTARAD